MSASSTKLKEPNILLAAANCQRMLRNIEYVLDAKAVTALQAEIDRNVAALFRLGDDHLEFARTIAAVPHWRQKISRLYYAAYTFRRAVALHHDGHFATDASDHKSVGELPRDFPNANTFETRLQTLRDDRNLADYNHLAELADLLSPPADVETLVLTFRVLAHTYLTERGLVI